jgi:hypothetical protein
MFLGRLGLGIGVPSAGVVQTKFQFMGLTESDLLIGEGDFPADRQTLLHDRGGLFTGGYGNPVLSFPPFGCDNNLEAINKSLRHIGFISRDSTVSADGI